MFVDGLDEVPVRTLIFREQLRMADRVIEIDIAATAQRIVVGE